MSKAGLFVCVYRKQEQKWKACDANKRQEFLTGSRKKSLAINSRIRRKKRKMKTCTYTKSITKLNSTWILIIEKQYIHV